MASTVWRPPVWLRGLRSIEEWLSRASLGLAMVCIVVVCVCTSLEVVMRFVLASPTAFTDVLSRVALIWGVFLATASAFRQGAAIAAQMILTIVPIGIAKLLQFLSGFASFVFFVIIVVTGFQMVVRTGSQQLAGLGISISWVYLALPLGGMLAGLSIFVRTCELLQPGTGLHKSHDEQPL